MKLQSVKHYKNPVYPDKREVLDNPNILKSLPERWKGNVRAGIAFSWLLAFTLTACAKQPAKEVDRHIVAPVFKHGDSRGSYGCMVVAPPTYLSEEEAFEAINSEAMRFGVNFQVGGPELEGKRAQPIDGMPDKKSTGLVYKLDGYESKRKIAFEFVSGEDRADIPAACEYYGSVYRYDFYKAAGLLKQEADTAPGEMAIGIFYEPAFVDSKSGSEKFMEYMKDTPDTKDRDEYLKYRKERGSEFQMEIKGLSEKFLRQQVKDFFNWLKGQGII